jgi:CBS domain-containing protein
MITTPDENPFEVLARGESPNLSALKLHNGTVWRWNRACYGVADGIAHLRIENRALPAGPTVVDEIANAVFFTGLMISLPKLYPNISARMKFDDAKSNFFRAARYGLDAQFDWIDGQTLSAASLILDHLLPLAQSGLKEAEVDQVDVEKYLGIIRNRVTNRATGARWTLAQPQQEPQGTINYLQRKQLTAAMLSFQKQGQPVDTWPLKNENDWLDWPMSVRTVEQFMSTDLFTVRPNDLLDLAANGMNWRHIRHVPVEAVDGKLAGLITHRTILRLMCERSQVHDASLTVADVMVLNPVTVSPATPALEAIEIMQHHKIGCLPVVADDQLVGIVTSYDFLLAAAQLLKLSTPQDKVAIASDDTQHT